MEKKLQVYVNLCDCIDSMLFDSGTVIARYGTADTHVKLCVAGSVSVFYDHSIYFSASEMPEELLTMFKDGTVWESDNVSVNLNNWFAVCYVEHGIVTDDEVYESDIAKMTVDELEASLAEWLKWYEEER